MLDRARFATEILALSEALGGKLGPATVGLYFATLRDLSDVAWKRALARAASGCKFMPRPAELLEFAQEQSAGDRALVAWQEAIRAAANPGRYASVDFEDPAINAAIRGLGGWVRFCGLEGDERDVWGKKEFERQYAAFARGVTPELSAPLPGLVEAWNVGKGAQAPAPRLIAATTRVQAKRIAPPQPVRSLAAGAKEPA